MTCKGLEKRKIATFWHNAIFKGHGLRIGKVDNLAISTFPHLLVNDGSCQIARQVETVTLPDRRDVRFYALDGLRGIAALLVAFAHLCTSQGMRNLVPRAYLAVDFFFVLSGFVIAYTYDERLRGNMTPQSFITNRLIRLGPMIVIAALTAVIVTGATRPDGGPPPLRQFLVSALAGLFLLVPACQKGALYPLNPPLWSLAVEVYANAAYGFSARIKTRTLAAAVSLFAIGVGYAILKHGWANIGWDIGTYKWGFVRAGYSFGLGVLINRLRPVSTSLPFSMLCIVLITVLCAPGLHGPGFELFSVVVLFPFLVHSGRAVQLSDWQSRLCSFSGRMSYPVYALHYTLLPILTFLRARYGFVYWSNTLVIAAFMLAFLAICLILLEFVDEPVRTLLSSRCRLIRTPAASVP